MSSAKELDPYTAKAEDNKHTPLATRTDICTPALWLPPVVTLVFIANKASHKFDEIQNDQHVNVSFYDEQTTNWASYCGTARVSQDKALIEKHWSHLTSAWFGDLKDGVHKGDQNDPRVTVIEVIPDTIRYWLSTESTLAKAADIATSALTGRTSAPGELRTITKDEIQLSQGIDGK